MTKDCDEALENLYLYLDSELDSVTSSRIRSHLDECRGCGPQFDFEGRLKAVVRERLHEDVPDAVVDRVRAALHEESAANLQ
ncbi:MAG: mycothiol system anti-sigma-R factor [Acidimicrobiia bacterium]|jgi:mycothiol system anti-sigma-R factor